MTSVGDFPGNNNWAFDMPLADKSVPVLLETEEQIRNVYGDWFCNTVGIENLIKMPEVTAESLNLHIPKKYPRNTVTVELFKGISSGVKGFDCFNRPFIAILVERYDNRENKIFKYVEVIFKRYSINFDGGKGKLHEDNYVSALENTCDDGQSRESVFYQTGATYDWNHLRKLLGGEPIRTTLMEYSEGYVRKI